ncbi:MAG: hypothetical protein KAR42_13345, partial [candidate division Zixibacteria bacterium]|nr:hypothetical protein [candidate division Zixibacteria bacterium]
MSNEIKTVEQMETAIREHFKAMLPAELREYIKKQEMYSPTPLLKHEAIDFIIENKREDIADADSQRLS